MGGRKHKVYFVGGGTTTPCPLLPSSEVLDAVGGIVVHALNLRDKEKCAPPPF